MGCGLPHSAGRRNAVIEQKYLDEFAYFGDRIYLDCSTMGMQPERTRKAAEEYLRRFSDGLGRDRETLTQAVFQRGKQAVARLIHCAPEDVFFTLNTTWGNNLLARGLALEPGDEVLVGNGDFPAVYMPWTSRQREGVRLTVVPNRDGIVDAEGFLAAITPRTRVIAVSLAQSSSGYLMDIGKLGRVCRERGILLSVDAVQAAGRVPIDVEEMNVDVLACASFKGLLGVMGAGFCWCRPEVMARVEPPYLSGNVDWEQYGSLHEFEALGIPEYPQRAARMETGTSNLMGLYAMSRSLELLLEIGVDEIAAAIREVEAYYRKRLADARLEVTLLGSGDPARWSGSISFRYKPSLKGELERALDAAGIYAAVRDSLRVGLHYYNTTAQIDRLMEVLERVIPRREADAACNL